MNTPLLIAASVIIPLVWGWGTYLVFERLWPPAPPSDSDKRDQPRPPGPPFDYQI